ncbi:MAG: glutathione S-transferase family protein [Gammaproteobacteria bacterium]|jgi:glutathione S-transferase|nr:glutathione S-transferase family protein [Gammaproteobacteria bacterium]MDP6733673.1 glutathione S-transferase family protein [Gammaproteobacteria bacterium]|tara:strand:+ start:478 stop:1101 length:624 start_codon:yes stop_codon:yes gene_type:complete
MKLYGMEQSRSFRCLWALEEAGIEYEYVPVKLRTVAEDPDSAQNPRYLAVNVQGKVPTLVNDDLVLTESVAILYYIARLAPESGLLPNASMNVYAQLDEMVCFVLAELEQPLWSKGKHTFALPEEQRIPQLLETAKFEFAKAVNTLDHLLGDGEFAIADSFTLVDILLAQTFNWAIRFEFDVPEKYIELRNRHYERPAAKRAMAVIT